MPAIVYMNEAGERVPSVTTVLSGNLAWNKRQLMIWANKLGLSGQDLWSDDKTEATVGTVAHAYVTDDAAGDPLDVDHITQGNWPALSEEQLAKVRYCCKAWLLWKEMHGFETVADECSLVSETHQFGGTLDLAMVQGRRMICDLKTGKGVYRDMLLQIAAYGMLWNETHPNEPVEGYALLLLGKYDGAFHYHVWPELELEKLAFIHCLELHKIHQTIKQQRGI